MNSVIESEKSLSLYPIDYPFESLISRATSNPPKLILNPEFQRKYKWDKEGNNERASAFIESCLMRIPLPACYFVEKEDGRHEVIDGVQRITTIVNFFNDAFALEGLTIFTELEGKKFSELSSSLQSDLENTTIRCIILRKENNKSIVKEIFARLNKGAVNLSPQEIRHAIYPGKFDELLTELGSIETIRRFGVRQDMDEAELKRRKNSLEPEEMVLRFFAFYFDLADYEKEKFDNLNKFLDRFMEKQQSLDVDKISEWQILFNSTLDKCTTIFEDNTFGNIVKQGVRHNLDLYDTLMWSFAQYPKETLIANKGNLIDAYRIFCDSTQYRTFKTHGVHRSGIIGKREHWNSLISSFLNS